jgi:hypothetical protein
MKSEKRLSRVEEAKETAQFVIARQLLQGRLVHKRDILNGRDFLFSGPADEIHEALKCLVEVEHRNKRFLQFDYAQVDEFFLLRVAGTEEHRQLIHSYFD